MTIAHDTLTFLRRSVPSEGKVVGYEADDGNDFSVSFYVRVCFEDSKGVKRVVAVKNIGNAIREYEEGAVAPILFDPENPEDTRLHTFTGIWLPVVLSAIAMGICIGIGASAWISAERF